MNILYLTNGFPFPLTSGYLRHYFLIRELSQRHNITLLSLVNSSYREEHAEALAPFTERVLTFKRAATERRAFRKVIHGMRLLTGSEPATRQLRKAVKQLTSEHQYDAVLFSGKHTLPAIELLRGLPLVADVCDAASVRIRGRLRHASYARYPWLMAGYMFMRRVEKNLVGRASHLMFASCRDRDALLAGAAPQATVVPNGVDLDFWKRSSDRLGRNAIVFTGAMHYAPNTDAALHLIRDIHPRVQQSVPDAELLIVGRDPPPHLLDAATGRPGVTVTGFVDDVRPYLERAAVFAAPLRFAAGIQNKVLEAMAMELPVIASPSAAGGLTTDSGHEPPIEIVDGATAFADAILSKLPAGAEGAPTDSAARDFVERHFSWRQGAEKLESILDAAVQQRRETQPSQTDSLPLPLPEKSCS